MKICELCRILQTLTTSGGQTSESAIDIHADYVAKNGAPNASAPKIFFRYYYVNSSTSEKSGTMLAECKWTAADAGGEP